MKKTLLLMVLMLATVGVKAQKQLYLPQYGEPWRTDTSWYMESDPDNKAKYSKSRSRENENFIVYWENKWGNTAPDELPKSNRNYVDIDDLLEKANYFYSLNVGKLGFCDEKKSNVGKYKMIICLLWMEKDDDWNATGSGYDNVIGALWITPSTCKPVGHTIAHEIGHSFQYQCFADLGGYAGFRTAIGNGSTFWEQTAQWQAAQAYPDKKWSESWLVYGNVFFPKTYNYAMTHEHMRYQSYWWHYYLAEKYGIDFIGRLWRHDAGKGVDPNEVLMNLLDIDSNELYRMYFEYAMKLTTGDIDVDGIKTEALPYIENFPLVYNYICLGGRRYQVAYSSCPQSTGFNAIELDVPEAGTTITTKFTSPKSPIDLAESDPVEFFNENGVFEKATNKTKYNINTKWNNQRGYRLGYVALLNDGSRKYIYEDSLYCGDGGSGDKTVEVSATVPENTKKMWLVVSPAPRAYIQHKWDENVMNDDQWPYIVEFKNTNIPGAPLIDASLPISDATITYDVAIPYDSQNFSGTNIVLGKEALFALGSAFQMPATEVMSRLVTWKSSGPADGQVMFYPLNPTTGKTDNSGSTANGYGHWFNASGKAVGWSDGTLYSELNTSSIALYVGQYPGKMSAGKSYKAGQAFVYKRGNETATVKIYFNVSCVAATESSAYSLNSVQQAEVVTGISSTASETAKVKEGIYNLAGQRLAAPQRGLNIINGKRVYVK